MLDICLLNLSKHIFRINKPIKHHIENSFISKNADPHSAFEYSAEQA